MARPPKIGPRNSDNERLKLNKRDEPSPFCFSVKFGLFSKRRVQYLTESVHGMQTAVDISPKEILVRISLFPKLIEKKLFKFGSGPAMIKEIANMKIAE